jgi:hypothetical protein
MDSKAIILSTLAYFDLFQYPVTAQEIRFFLPHPLSPSELDRSLEELQESGIVFMWEGFHAVRNEEALVQRRRKGNLLAADMLHTAEKVAALLARFPYIRGVGVSGSLSKHYADEGSDIDLFIITAKNRLWVARTLLHLLKKMTFIIRREDWFCMNYFVDELALEIPEKNIYTAIEIVTLMPMQGQQAFTDFAKANRWTDGVLPHSGRQFALPRERKASLLKKMLEGLLNNAFGDLLDGWFMRLTAGRWLRKTQAGKKNNRGVVMSLAATRHSARPEPGDYQKGLLQAYERKVQEMQTRLGVEQTHGQFGHHVK